MPAAAGLAGAGTSAGAVYHPGSRGVPAAAAAAAAAAGPATGEGREAEPVCCRGGPGGRPILGGGPLARRASGRAAQGRFGGKRPSRGVGPGSVTS